MFSQKVQEESKVPANVAGDQEMLANMFMAPFAKPLRDGRIGKQESNLVRSALDRMRQ